jgi:glycosyltransferase involved in cell wall biosynthesis
LRLARYVRLHHIDHIHAYWASTPATVALVASVLTGVPFSFTAHRWDITENNLLRLKCRRATFVRAISASGKTDIEATTGLVGLGHLKIIHLGVHLPATARPSERLNDPPVVCVPASLVKKKGHAYMLSAVSNMVRKGLRLRVLLAGDGPLRLELERQSARLGLGSTVSFLGNVPHEDLIQMFQDGRVDLVVLPSVLVDGETEGIPVGLMEAMAAGVPVVSTSIGGTPELLREGAGVEVSPQDASALAEAVSRLLADQALRRSVAAAGRVRVASEFDIATVANLMLKAFRKPEPDA